MAAGISEADMVWTFQLPEQQKYRLPAISCLGAIDLTQHFIQV
jgi:hypothetical protein